MGCKGFSQVEGVDFDELFAAVAHKDLLEIGIHVSIYMDRVNKGWLAKTRRGMDLG